MEVQQKGSALQLTSPTSAKSVVCQVPPRGGVPRADPEVAEEKRKTALCFETGVTLSSRQGL